MTSSHRAIGLASVRATPVDGAAPAGVWALDELAVAALPIEASLAGAPASAMNAGPSAQERAQMIDEAYARGLADGEKKGLAAAQARVTKALAVIDKITGEVRDVAALAPSILEENIAALAVIVARQIVAREVSVARELVADLVRRALTEFPVDQSTRIRVHPLDLSLLTLNEGGMAPITGARDVSWLADARVARGGCLVEGRDRIVDGRVDTALERAYHRMAQIDAS